MKKYIGTKEVSATPAWRVDGVVYPKDGAMPRVMNREDGYKVVYEDGYESWSPKEVFEKTYKPADTFLDRMKIEHDGLQRRLRKLDLFIDSEKFLELPFSKRTLLTQQYSAMLTYCLTLKNRIKLEEER